MTQETASFARRCLITTKTVAVVAAATMATVCLDVSAQESVIAGARGIEAAALSRAQSLEQVFWQCDYASTQVALDSGTAAYCSVVNEELKQAKFGGDHGAMNQWWQQNKATEHARVNATWSRATRR